MANVCGTLSALLNLTQVHRDVEWRCALWVTPAGLVGIVPGALPSLDLTGWLVLAGALAVGLVAGNLVARRIEGRAAMRLVIGIAAVGAATALAQGIRGL